MRDGLGAQVEVLSSRFAYSGGQARRLIVDSRFMAGSPAMPRLVLWNVDHTLVDVGKVTREAYAEAFQRVTGRPLVRLAATADRTESEIIFEILAFNDVVT